jgi:hypothetical protein
LLGRGVRSQGWSGLLTYLCRNTYTVLWKPPAYWPCGIFEASPGGHDWEATCPFAGCRAQVLSWGMGGLAHFCLLIPQTQQVLPLRWGKRGSISSGWFLLAVGWKEEVRCMGTFLRGWPLWSPGGSDRTGQRGHASAEVSITKLRAGILSLHLLRYKLGKSI